MKEVLRKTRLAMRESSDMSKLLASSPAERSIVVYAEDTFSYVQLKGYLDALWELHARPFNYVTSDPEDPVLKSPPPGGRTWYIRDQLARFMGRLECGVLVTTMPDLGKFHVPRPKAGRTLYAFHSLNSTHTAYRNGAFDNYDQFMCTGPHHVTELTHLRRESLPILSEVGYYKLDLIREEHEAFETHSSPESDLVLLAPSWGEKNLLEAHGHTIVESLLSAGFRVIVRPHPQFFHSLYPRGAEVMEDLAERFGDLDEVEFEMNIETQDSFHRSAVMVSDWSGAAYEFALGTLRPVLFVDTPQKVFNEDWAAVGLPSFEKVMREEVGALVSKDDVSKVGSLVDELASGSRITAGQLSELADSVVFNPTASSESGARVIANALESDN